MVGICAKTKRKTSEEIVRPSNASTDSCGSGKGNSRSCGSGSGSVGLIWIGVVVTKNRAVAGLSTKVNNSKVRVNRANMNRDLCLSKRVLVL